MCHERIKVALGYCGKTEQWFQNCTRYIGPKWWSALTVMGQSWWAGLWGFSINAGALFRRTHYRLGSIIDSSICSFFLRNCWRLEEYYDSITKWMVWQNSSGTNEGYTAQIHLGSKGNTIYSEWEAAGTSPGGSRAEMFNTAIIRICSLSCYSTPMHFLYVLYMLMCIVSILLSA